MLWARETVVAEWSACDYLISDVKEEVMLLTVNRHNTTLV